MGKNGKLNVKSQVPREKLKKSSELGACYHQRDIREELANVMADSERWLNTPNPHFGGRKPVDVIGTEEERFIREWIGRVKHGYVS